MTWRITNIVLFAINPSLPIHFCSLRRNKYKIKFYAYVELCITFLFWSNTGTIISKPQQECRSGLLRNYLITGISSKKNDAKESISLNSAHRKRKSNDDKHKTVAESTQIKMVEK